MANINGLLLIGENPSPDRPSGGLIDANITSITRSCSVKLNQTTPNQVITLPPVVSSVSAGTVMLVHNTGTASFSVYGVNITPTALVEFVWDGTQWDAPTTYYGLGGHIPDLALFNTVSLSANQNNWNPAGLSTAIGYIVSLPSGNVNITGITNPSVHRLLWIFNNSTNHIRLMNQDGASTAANRIKCPDSANFEIKDNALTQVLYVPLLNRWIVVNEVKD